MYTSKKQGTLGRFERKIVRSVFDLVKEDDDGAADRRGIES